MIIGLCGTAGAGKNTVADILVEDYGFQAVSFAGPVYEAVSAITGLPVEHLQDRRYKEKPIGWLGSSPRELLQTLGTDWGRKMIHENLWIVIALNNIAKITEAGGNVVVTDVRFDNEATALTLAGGSVWQVNRPCETSCGRKERDHDSENGVSQDLVNVVINNDSTVHYLRERVNREMEFANVN
jgi:cytidylate kinase